jgi:hypothetical protein
MSNNTSLRDTLKSDVSIPEFPRQDYRFRITKQPEFRVSSKGKDMHVFECEVVEPTIVTAVTDKKTGEKAEFDITGTKVRIYALVQPPAPTLLGHMYLACGLDIDNPQFSDDGSILDEFEGKEFIAFCDNRAQELLDGEGKRVVNPLTGKPVEARASLNVVKVYVGN